MRSPRTDKMSLRRSLRKSLILLAEVLAAEVLRKCGSRVLNPLILLAEVQFAEVRRSSLLRRAAKLRTLLAARPSGSWAGMSCASSTHVFPARVSIVHAAMFSGLPT